MCCWSCHRLRVAWRRTGASPSPTASRHPWARANEASDGGDWRQKAPARPPSTDDDTQAFSDSLARLSRNEYVSVADEIDQLQRDLFEPTAVMETAFTPVETNPPPELAATAARSAVREADFQTSHNLEGVLLGRTPLAVIDGHVLAVNSDLDGYTLLEVQRDRVVFQQPATGARVVLELSQGPKTP